MVDNLSTFLGISCQEKIGMGRPQFAEYGIFAEISGAQTVNFQVHERLGGSQVHILLRYFGKRAQSAETRQVHISSTRCTKCVMCSPILL